MRIKKTTIIDVDETVKIYLKAIDILKKYDVLDKMDLLSELPNKRLLVDQSFEKVQELLIEEWNHKVPNIGDLIFNYGVDMDNLENKLEGKENKEIVELIAGEVLGAGFTTFVEEFDVMESVLLEDTITTNLGRKGRWGLSFEQKFLTFKPLEGSIFKRGWIGLTNGFLASNYSELGKDIWKVQFLEGATDFILRLFNQLNILDNEVWILSFDGKPKGTIESKVDLAIKIVDKLGIGFQSDWLNDNHEKNGIIGMLV